MIVGDGDLASVLPSRPDLTFFASGVSNSQETRESEYGREFELLLTQDRLAHTIYFSSLAIFYSDTRYTQHKKFMEGKVKQLFPRHTIIRLGNISWGKNPHTLINYLRSHPEAEIRDEYRYVIDEPEFLHWMSLIPDFNCEMNTPGQMLTIKEIWSKYVKNP